MTIADVSLLFDVVLAVLLAVMIFYAVKLNQRIVLLRNRESDMQDMVTQFNESSVIAQDSAQKLRAAGTEAEFGVKAAIAKGMALRNDLELMLDQAELFVERIDEARSRPVPQPQPKPESQNDFGELPPQRETASNVSRFSPPVRSAEEVIRSGSSESSAATEQIQPRNEAEKQLLEAIRAAKEGTA